MKKVLLAASIASALSLANFAHAAAGGTITFNGSITDQTCNVVVNGGTENATVTLPPVAASLLTAANSKAGAMPVTYTLTGCNAVPPLAAAQAFGVSVYYEAGANVDSVNSVLNNTATGATAATKVALEIIDKNDDVVPLGKTFTDYGTADLSMLATDTGGTINHKVRYKSIPGGATVGTVTSSVVYNLAYH
jgi:major type 1 subunit fimbrin (pilin)